MNEKKHTPRRVLMAGAVSPAFVAESISAHSSNTGIGAHTIFLGQVRNDLQGDKKVIAIEYSAYETMAEKIFQAIREQAFEKYSLTCLHMYHSTGLVKAGEISLFVFVSAKHRKEVFGACGFIVEEIKAKAPVWGKELMEDGSHIWKENKPAGLSAGK